MALFKDDRGLPETVPENTPVLVELTPDKSQIVYIRVFKDMHELLNFYIVYCYKNHTLNHFLYKVGITVTWWYEIVKSRDYFPCSKALTFDDHYDTEHIDRVLSMHLSAVLVQSSYVYDIVEYPMDVEMFEDSAE